jgi:hypothetical protein
MARSFILPNIHKRAIAITAIKIIAIKSLNKKNVKLSTLFFHQSPPRDHGLFVIVYSNYSQNISSWA